jgi:hypothetical protein
VPSSDNEGKRIISEVGALTSDLEGNGIFLGLSVGAPSFGKKGIHGFLRRRCPHSENKETA